MAQTTAQTQAYIWFTNRSKRTCTLSGFAGVDMIGAQKTDGTWSLARSSKKPVKMTLEQGDTVDFSTFPLVRRGPHGTGKPPTDERAQRTAHPMRVLYASEAVFNAPTKAAKAGAGKVRTALVGVFESRTEVLKGVWAISTQALPSPLPL